MGLHLYPVKTDFPLALVKYAATPLPSAQSAKTASPTLPSRVQTRATKKLHDFSTKKKSYIILVQKKLRTWGM